MKKIVVLLINTFFSFVLHAQGIIGAWETTFTSDKGNLVKSVFVLTDGYQVLSSYEAGTGKFIYTRGGRWKLTNNLLTETIEFHTEKPELVGTEAIVKVRITDNEIELLDSGVKFKRVDDGSPGKLPGTWLMSGRIVDGKMQVRDTSGPRKTIKILSGTRFQWIAYDTATRQFMGTGGGTYTTQNGEYTESIEFFSNDQSKVGLCLKFTYKLIAGNWHHAGLSSKGDPIDEIWSKRE